MLAHLDAIDEILIGTPASEMEAWPFALNPANVVSLSVFHRDVTTIRYAVGNIQHSVNVRGSVTEVFEKLQPPLITLVPAGFRADVLP